MIPFKYTIAKLKIENFTKKGRECILGLKNLHNSICGKQLSIEETRHVFVKFFIMLCAKYKLKTKNKTKL